MLLRKACKNSKSKANPSWEKSMCMEKEKEERIMPSLVATTSVLTHYSRTKMPSLVATKSRLAQCACARTMFAPKWNPNIPTDSETSMNEKLYDDIDIMTQCHQDIKTCPCHIIYSIKNHHMRLQNFNFQYLGERQSNYIQLYIF